MRPRSRPAHPFNSIQFSLAAGSSIIPLSALPTITQPLHINAPYTQNSSGAQVPEIVVNGSKAGAATVGFDIQAASTTIQDLAIDGFGGGGVLLDGAKASGDQLIFDYIGVNAAGTVGAGNGAFGVELRGGARSNAISKSVISANSGDGVVLTGTGTSNNSLMSNLIGTDATGTHALGNTSIGVLISLGATNTTISAGNVISGNGYCGLYITDPGTTGNLVIGDRIGTNLAGTAALGNAGTGVEIANGASSNTIGAGDVISGNTWNGVAITGAGTEHNVVSGAFIGIDVYGTHVISNGNIGAAIVGGASYNTIGTGSVISGNAADNVYLSDAGTSNNTVSGNFIGTDAAGTHALGSSTNILITSGAANNTIGGTTSSTRNLISGSRSYGVALTGVGTSHNLVEGNFIGTNAAGTGILGNGTGVEIASGASFNTIGGTTAAQRNVITGNGSGVEINGSSTQHNVVEGDFIGTDVTGEHALGNTYNGVTLDNGTAYDVIGSTLPGAANVIASNGVDGVELTDFGTVYNTVAGNMIGTDLSGSANLGNGGFGVAIINAADNNTVGGPGGPGSPIVNLIKFNVNGGVFIGSAGTAGNWVESDLIEFNGGDGVYIASAPGNDVISCIVVFNSNWGIALSASNPTILLGNTVNGNGFGSTISM